MRTVVMTFVFLMFAVSGFCQWSVQYNAFSGEYEHYVPTMPAPSSTSPSWQENGAGVDSLVTDSNQPHESQTGFGIQSQGVSIGSQPLSLSTGQEFYSGGYTPSSSVSGFQTGGYSRKDNMPQFQVPSIRWKFAKPQQGLLEDGGVDEAMFNNPGIIATDDAHAGVIAEEDRGKHNWSFVDDKPFSSSLIPDVPSSSEGFKTGGYSSQDQMPQSQPVSVRRKSAKPQPGILDVKTDDMILNNPRIIATEDDHADVIAEEDRGKYNWTGAQ